MGQHRSQFPVFAVVVGFAVACAAEPRGDRESDGASGVGPADTGSEESDDAGDDGETGVLFDVGGSGTGGNGGDNGGDGCQKVDFLFVIDSSGSMMSEQEALLLSFPRFIDAIVDTLGVRDFHVMVVDAGAVEGAGCDGVLGAGQVRDGEGNDCSLTSGVRYATPAQPDLHTTFSCMASRGNFGSGNEETMLALTNAIGTHADPGGCNEGFVRDDAILVVTVITDEEDDPDDVNSGGLAFQGECTAVDGDTNSPGGPQAWYEAVVAAKHGDPEAAVVLSLIGDCDIGGSCPGMDLDFGVITGAEPAPRIRTFTELFPHGSTGPICADDYSPFFEAAVSTIDLACDEFIPPG